jgi:hypothetical protein
MIEALQEGIVLVNNYKAVFKNSIFDKLFKEKDNFLD